MKITIVIYTFTLTFSISVLGKYIDVGDICSSFSGDIPCRPGLHCCRVLPDLSLCYDGDSCPSKFLNEGELCSGIGGLIPYPCYPGTTCCNINPDISICSEKC